jgi:mono/diheme cytochrome c family protein
MLAVLGCLPFLQIAPEALPGAAKLAGRLHVLMLHFPIGLMAVALVLEAGREPRVCRWLPAVPGPVAGLVLGLGAVSAFLAAVCGWLLAAEGGLVGLLVTRHFYAGIVCAGAAVGAWMLQAASLAQPESGTRRKAAVALLAAANALVVVTGHLGGTLTHGEDFLTEHAPAVARRILGLPPPKASGLPTGAGEDREVYAGVVHPILHQRCHECHNEQKAKGDLRLDTYAEALKALVPGQPEESKIIRHIRLPLDHDDHMPPQGKPQLTAGQIALLEWWVKAGAGEKARVKDLNPPAAVREALRNLN